jgi:hypothetical protein
VFPTHYERAADYRHERESADESGIAFHSGPSIPEGWTEASRSCLKVGSKLLKKQSLCPLNVMKRAAERFWMYI